MKSNRFVIPIITVFSTALVSLIVALFFLPGYEGDIGFNVYIFPLLNAVFNGFTFVFLIVALAAIKNKKIQLHRNFIMASFVTTAMFLVSYVIYHFLTEPTEFGGGELLKYIYYFLLITHVLLAVVNVPLALLTAARGIQRDVKKHRKLARWAMPIWVYVSGTGVIVYILISPYY